MYSGLRKGDVLLHRSKRIKVMISSVRKCKKEMPISAVGSINNPLDMVITYCNPSCTKAIGNCVIVWLSKDYKRFFPDATLLGVRKDVCFGEELTWRKIGENNMESSKRGRHRSNSSVAKRSRNPKVSPLSRK